jgi:hypothetical protein
MQGPTLWPERRERGRGGGSERERELGARLGRRDCLQTPMCSRPGSETNACWRVSLNINETHTQSGRKCLNERFPRVQVPSWGSCFRYAYCTIDGV